MYSRNHFWSFCLVSGRQLFLASSGRPWFPSASTDILVSCLTARRLISRCQQSRHSMDLARLIAWSTPFLFRSVAPSPKSKNDSLDIRLTT